MQDSTPAIPHWLFQALQVLGYLGLGGAVVKFYELYQNRNRPKVEVHKVEAETTEIVVRTQVAASDALDRIVGRLEAALATTDRLRAERDDLREKCDRQDGDIEAYERQMKRVRRYLEDNGLDFNDLIVKSDEVKKP